MEEIVIKLSKRKIAWNLQLSVLFMAMSVFVWTIADTIENWPPLFIKAVSVAGVLFSGIMLIYGFIKLFDKKPGIVINKEGITDNCSAVSAGLIKWRDITEIGVGSVKKARFILIHVSNPNDYLAVGNRIKRFLMKQNMKMYGTPISLTSKSLDYNFDELLKLILKAKAEATTVLH